MPFLTPPISDEDDRQESKNLLKLAVQTKFSDKDVNVLTKMDISIPIRSQDLKYHLKNIANLATICIGKGCLLYTNLQRVTDHIQENEIDYNYESLEMF